MKILADMGVSQTTVKALRENGYDVKHLSDENLQKLPDSQIVEKARRERSVVITFDLDFGELLAVSKEKVPSAIIFRLKNQSSLSVTPRLLQVLRERKKDLEAGAIIIVEEKRYRVRRLPISKIPTTSH